MITFERLSNGQGRMTVRGEGKYILLPICESDNKEELTCEYGCMTGWRLTVPSYTGRVLFYAPINKGHGQITLTGNFSDGFFQSIRTTDSPQKNNGVYPAIHFAARSGWINDPNGLIYHDGVYNMYFQYNPVDTVWGNMSWGHATSTDLLHWQQEDDAMYPDGDGTIFSGSALANNGAYRFLPDNALLFFYTCAGNTSRWSKGKPFAQKMAYSLDGGKTLIKIQKPVVEQITEGNRDPKVYRYKSENLYYMALYLENGEFAVLNSTDLQNFTVTQRFCIEGSGECPDLRPVPCEDQKERWIFMEADGHYLVGSFDGSRFLAESELLTAFHTDLFYAGQTVNRDDERVIYIPWMRTHNKNCTYTGMMGLARELTLVPSDGSYRLRFAPVKEYFDARRAAQSPEYSFGAARAKEIELCGNKASFSKVMLGNIPVTYDRKSGILNVAYKEIPFEKELDGLNIYIDKGIIEISSPDFLHLAAVEADENEQQGMIIIDTPENYIRTAVYEI